MIRRHTLHPWATLVITLLVGLSQVAFGVQDKTKKTKKPPPTGKLVMWSDPGDISMRDLFIGPGGEEMKPDLSSVTFIKKETGGFSTKYRVRDGAGRVWVAKVSKEARPETASSRLAWAAGYKTEIHYLYPCVVIKGAPPPKGDGRCEGNGYANVRFEARPKNYKRLDKWSWASNPFTGTSEFKGLIVLMGLLNNWDLKDDNNKIVYVPGGEGGEDELQYIISDLGATFGKTGGFISRSRNEPEDYGKSKFIEGVEGGRVKFAYSGKNSGLFKDITVEQARWLGQLLSRLSDQQLTDAFRAANFSAEEIQILVPAVRAKIDQLVNLPGATGVAGTN